MAKAFFLGGPAGGHPVPVARAAPGLHVVATPIGNLGDITLRALHVLAGADLILCEDRRVTRVLCDHFSIGTPLHSLHEHNEAAEVARLVPRLQAGEAFALVSDAGTPLVSDPGFVLIRAAIAAGVAVYPLPGPSAVLAALVGSGLPADRFFFEGFLPAKAGERRRRLQHLASVPAALVLYEAPHRVRDSLGDMAAVLGARPAVLAREITKRFETFRRGTLASLAAELAAEEAPRGEIVIVIGAADDATAPFSDDDLDAALAVLMRLHSARDAATILAGERGLPRRKVYARAVALAARGAELPLAARGEDDDSPDMIAPRPDLPEEGAA